MSTVAGATRKTTNLGKLVRQRRLELGLTQEELAALISDEGEEIRQADISRIERGYTRLPRPERLARIARALDVPAGELLGSAFGAADGGSADPGIDPESTSGEASSDSTYPPAWAESGFYQRLLDQLDQAVIVTDPDGVIRYWNAYATALYGWQAAEVLGRNIMTVTVAQASAQEAEEIMEQLRAGKSWRGPFLLRRRDGSTFEGIVVDSPVLDDGGNLVAIIGISSATEDAAALHDDLRC